MAVAPLNKQPAVFEGLLWMGGLVLVILLATLILAWARHRIHASGLTNESMFTLEDLRRMRDRGDVTAAEYEALKRKVVQGMERYPKPGRSVLPDNVLQPRRRP